MITVSNSEVELSMHNIIIHCADCISTYSDGLIHSAYGSVNGSVIHMTHFVSNIKDRRVNDKIITFNQVNDVISNVIKIAGLRQYRSNHKSLNLMIFIYQFICNHFLDSD